MFRRLAVLLLALVLAACNLSVPQATPTVAPTRTPSLTPEATRTIPPTAVAFVASPTFTTTPTETPTLTPSLTPTLTPTNTNEPTATPTLTNTPLPTATETPPPTVTPLPLIPTETPTNTPPPTLTPTGTFTATSIPTATWTPSPTNTATLPPLPTATANPLGTATPERSALEMTLMAERTAAVPTPAPTLDVTPTYITAEATLLPDSGLTLTPIQSDTTPQPGLPTFTPQPQPTVALVVTLPPTLGAPPSMPTFIPVNPQTRAFALSTTGGGSSGGTGFSLPHNNPILFARNPVDPNLYVSTDIAGNLFLTGTMSYRPDMSPFSEFAPQSREENNAYVSTVAWSPDGKYLAFVINAKQASDNGVWYFQPGQFPPIYLMTDCPEENFVSCTIVSNPSNPDFWQTIELKWSPESDAILARVHLPKEERDAFALLPLSLNPRARDVRPPIFRYQSAAWEIRQEEQVERILVSGSGPDGSLGIYWLNWDGSINSTVFDPEPLGLWLGYANQAADGRIFALGAPGDRSGPREALSIYNMAGQPVSAPIMGDPAAPVERVEWSPDGLAVLVQIGARQFTASVTGAVNEITSQVQGAAAINWVSGNLPPSEELATAAVTPATPAVSGIPSGVIAGSAYQPGQQLRVYVLELNIRSGPGIEYPAVRGPLVPGDYVAILAGPMTTPDNVVWWQVQTADGYVGWIAGDINGSVTLGP